MLKKAALNMVIKMSDSSELDSLRREFVKIDKQGTGIIGEEGLHKVFETAGLSVSCEEVHNIISEVDYQGNGFISYTEFLAATFDIHSFVDDKKINAVFNSFDADNSGEITKGKLFHAM